MSELPKIDPMEEFRTTVALLLKRIAALEDTQPDRFTIAMSEHAYLETMRTIQVARGRDIETLCHEVSTVIRDLIEKDMATGQKQTVVQGMFEKRNRIEEARQLIDMLKKEGQEPKEFKDVLSSIWRGF